MRQTELVRRSADLRVRLGGDRGLLFSHPADFEETGFERDRWLALVQEACVTRHVLPLVSAARIGEGPWGWVWSIDARSCHVGVPVGELPGSDVVTPMDRGPLPLLLSAAHAHTRFVASIDADGRCRALYEYDARSRLGSLFDLIEVAARGIERRGAGRPGLPRARGG